VKDPGYVLYKPVWDPMKPVVLRDNRSCSERDEAGVEVGIVAAYRQPSFNHAFQGLAVDALVIPEAPQVDGVFTKLVALPLHYAQRREVGIGPPVINALIVREQAFLRIAIVRQQAFLRTVVASNQPARGRAGDPYDRSGCDSGESDGLPGLHPS
jgi:hypothetical protein